MRPGHTVRRATVEDTEAVRRVARASWQAAYTEFVEEDVVERMLAQGYSTEFLEGAIASSDLTLFVVETGDGGDIVGYATCEPPDAGTVGQVSIYVSPDHWGEGLGTALLDRAGEYLASAGATAIRDTVLAENSVGNAFYRKHFERIDDRTVEMGGEPYDACVYQGEL